MAEKSDNGTTNFGYKIVDANEKVNLVSDVFQSVFNKYDLMNDIMSFGLHRFWKSFSIDCCKIQPNDKVLDVATGTGDLAKKIASKLSSEGELYTLDLEMNMLSKGRENIFNSGYINNVYYSQGNAELLPYPDSLFDLVTIGFGLRNVTSIEKVLQEFFRVLKPNGKIMILEFSKIDKSLEWLYDKYSFEFIPKIGDYITGDKDSYQYLVESIRMHPGQQELADMIHKAGFKHCIYENLTFGFVSMHMAYK